MSDQLELDFSALDELKGSVRSTYMLWLEGHDVRSLMAKNTFYRHRKQLLEHGVDISLPSGKHRPDTDNIVPLVRTITLKPAVIPDWAYGTDFYFEPRKFVNP